MSSSQANHLHAVERLAGKMYTADNSNSIPWLRRGWTVRDIWMEKAREQLETAGSSLDRPGGWWNVLGKFGLLNR